MSLALSTNGRTLYSGSSDKTIKQWNVKTGKCTKTIQDGRIRSIVLSPDGKTLLSGASNPEFFSIRQWDIKTGKCIDMLKDWPIETLLLSKDGYNLFNVSVQHIFHYTCISTGDIHRGTKQTLPNNISNIVHGYLK